MTYPQQPGNWSDQQWSGGQQPYQDPNQPVYQDPSQQYYDAGQASGAPASPAYGYQQQGYQQQGYQQPGYEYPQQAAYPSYGYGAPVVAAPAPTNGLAIASLVCSLAGILTCGVVSIVGAILGHVSRKQIRERGDGGDGMALAGIIVGWVITGLYAAFWVFYLIVIVAVFSSASNGYPSTYPS
jgi:hypothetical protein